MKGAVFADIYCKGNNFVYRVFHMDMVDFKELLSCGFV